MRAPRRRLSESGTVYSDPGAVQIMDLEARLAQASEELAQVAHLGGGGGGGGGGKRGNREWIPSAPARHTFSGHRLAVNSLSFHPTFSSLATASEDTTIKVWDWESGELERTLKGHTKSVTDCQYDSKGKVLGMFVFISVLMWVDQLLV
jgi:platelet-activating factor acetylhydrolase IB subunit alpha